MNSEIFETHAEAATFLEEKKPCKIAAIDVGSRKIGLAISCANLSIAFPKKVVERKNFKQTQEDIANFLQNSEIELMVVGLPINMQGNETEQCELIRKFIAKLRKTLNFKVFFQDERLTTKMASQMLQMSGLSAKQSANKDDEVAASLILESFLKKINKS